MTGSMCLVEIDGSPMPAGLEPLLVSALVEDSQRLPDMFSLRFRDPERIVLAKSNAKVGGKITIKVNMAASSTPEDPDRGRDHRAGAGVRHQRHLHDHPRLRPRAPAVPRPPNRQLRPDDRLGHRHPGGEASEPQGGAGGQHQHRLPRGQPGRSERLGDPDPAGPGHRLGSDRPQRRLLIRRRSRRRVAHLPEVRPGS